MNISMTRGDTKQIIAACEEAEFPRAYTAYVLATTHHETGGTMKPVRETFAKTDAEAKARLEKAWKAGKLKTVKTPYWREGYYGRGYPQVTHLPNYARASKIVGVDLVRNPDLMMKPEIAIPVMLDGMSKGWFRSGHTLKRYLSGKVPDYYGARNIINGDTKVNGAMIAGYATAYERELAKQGYGAKPVPAEPRKIADTATVALIQQELWELGFKEVGSRRADGSFDGKPGTMTEAAVLAFRNERGLPKSAALDELLIKQLTDARLESWQRDIPDARAKASEQEVAAKVPEVKTTLRARVASLWTGVTTTAGGVGYGIVTNLPDAKGYVQPVQDNLPDIPQWVWFVVIGLAAAVIYWWMNKATKSGVERWRDGASR